MAYFNSATAISPPVSLSILKNSIPTFFKEFRANSKIFAALSLSSNLSLNGGRFRSKPFIFRCAQVLVSETESEYETEEEYKSDDELGGQEEGQAQDMFGNVQMPPPVVRPKQRYRKKYPGETKGITEEMRFVAMRLRKTAKAKIKRKNDSTGDGGVVEVEEEEESKEKDGNENNETWKPSMEGFLKYLVDSKLVFSTVERIVDESSDVSYVYFRKTGMERSDSISRDLELLSKQGIEIPEPSIPGITYAQYLEELAEKSPSLFLCNFYNIYFAHVAGGQVIAKQVSEKLLDGLEMDFFKWEGDAEELLEGVRDNLNALGQHWSRAEKNKCLREMTKTFRFLGQIVRLIV